MTVDVSGVCDCCRNPPQVVSCLGNLSPNAPVSAFTATCQDGRMLAQGLAMAARMSPFLQSIQPWRYPPMMDGCGLSDLLNLNLAVLPMVQCLDVNMTMLMDMVSTGQGSGQVRDVELMPRP